MVVNRFFFYDVFRKLHVPCQYIYVLTYIKYFIINFYVKYTINRRTFQQIESNTLKEMFVDFN